MGFLMHPTSSFTVLMYFFFPLRLVAGDTEFFRGGEGVILILTHLMLIFAYLSLSSYIYTYGLRSDSFFLFLPFAFTIVPCP